MIEKALTETAELQFLDSEAFEQALANDDGAAAKQHLAAGRAIYYRDPQQTDGIVRKYPDGRRQIVRIDSNYAVAVVRELPALPEGSLC